jgi:drug/metabolite transporter (DMT)-like permease
LHLFIIACHLTFAAEPYLLPFLGVLISAVTLHEHITGSMLIGGAITLAGAVMITLAESPVTEENAQP